MAALTDVAIAQAMVANGRWSARLGWDRYVDAEFRAARRKRSDLGLLHHALNLFLEPRNPFEPQRMRKPKMEATVFGTLLALVVIALLAFNLAAPQP